MLIDYSQRFKTTSDILKSQLCGYIKIKKIANDYASQDSNYDPNDDAKVTEVKKKVNEAFLSYVLLQGSDHVRYGSLNSNLMEQYALGQDQYLKEVATMINILSNHKYDDAYAEHQK